MSKQRVAVVGAGAFGGWTALSLLRRGADVTLLDVWGPGNARASSGGETRAIRAIYGGDAIYTKWVARAFEIWRESDARWGTQLYQKTGALWMCGEDTAYVQAALPYLAEHGLTVETLDLADARRRFPAISFEGAQDDQNVQNVYLEHEAGTLFARRACQTVARAFSDEGGSYLQRAARPGAIRGGAMRQIELSDGSRLAADVFVFACGPWLRELFPDVVGSALHVTRQEVYYFGAPGGALDEGELPIWIDMQLGYYGLPASEGRGFKVADDRRGPVFDPTAGDRTPTAGGIARARLFLGQRFPLLANAPLLEARVCQYTSSPDHHLVVDAHPDAANVWIVGGGSGHGFKLGPALGELMAGHALDGEPANPQLAIERLAKPGTPGPTIFATAGTRRVE